MSDPDASNRYMAQLRQWRNAPERDTSMAFLNKQFKAQIERPYKQLQKVIELWRAMVPPDLLKHTRLESLTRGVLRIAVDSSPRLYQLDQLLRERLERELITNFKGGSIRRIQLRLADDVTDDPA